MEEEKKYLCGCIAKGSLKVCPKHFEVLEGSEEAKEIKDEGDNIEKAIEAAQLAYIKATETLGKIGFKKKHIDQEFEVVKGKWERINAEFRLADIEAQAALSSLAITLQLKAGLIDKKEGERKLAGVMEQVKIKITRLAPQLRSKEEVK